MPRRTGILRIVQACRSPDVSRPPPDGRHAPLPGHRPQRRARTHAVEERAGRDREIARRLLGVRGPHFVWRLSVSDIEKDADFGEFPGVQRSATLIHGDGMILDVAGTEQEVTPFEPVTFDGRPTPTSA